MQAHAYSRMRWRTTTGHSEGKVKKPVLLLSITLVVGFVALGCQRPEPAGEVPAQEQGEQDPQTAESLTPVPSPIPTSSAAGQAEKSEAQHPEQVTVVHSWAGDQLAALGEVLQSFTADTSVEVELKHVPFAEFRSQLTHLVAVQNPPDIAILPATQLLSEFADMDSLVDLSRVLDMDQMRDNYTQTWLDLGSHRGTLHGIPMAVGSKSLVWYRPAALAQAGYSVPRSWDDMIKLSDRMVQDGRTPWCMGIEHGLDSGWVASDWIEDILLRMSGPETYDGWIGHEIPWTDPAVEWAWTLFGQIALNDEYVLGGTEAVTRTNFAASVTPLFQDPPGCYLHRQGQWVASLFPQNLEIGLDYDFFPFPSIDSAYGEQMVGWGSLAVMFIDRPRSRACMEFLATPTPEAQEVWLAHGGLLSPSKAVSPSTTPDIYSDDLSRRIAEVLLDVDTFRLDASDLMPIDVQQEFWKSTIDYLNGADLMETLERLESVAVEAYH